MMPFNIYIRQGLAMGNSTTWYVILGILILWTITWKAFALWHAARRGEKHWFIALLIINTFGILEIAYLVFVAKAFKKKI
jgi:hypothetical protein